MASDETQTHSGSTISASNLLQEGHIMKKKLLALLLLLAVAFIGCGKKQGLRT